MKDDKTIRFAHRDKAEKLLACFEGIDDDIVAEAAQAVSQRNMRKAGWLNMSNIAAAFIGAIAISSLLFMAYWLSNARPGEVPRYNDYNGPEGGYYADATPVPATPTPQPDNLLPFNSRALGDIALLEAGQTHMTINNPWHTAGHIDSLPVFRHHSLWRGMDRRNEIQISREEWAQFLEDVTQAGIQIAMAAGLDVSETFSRIDDFMMSFETANNELFMYMWLHSRPMARISFPMGSALLPDGANMSSDASQSEIQAAIEHIAGLISPPFAMAQPTLAQAEMTLDIGGPRTYARQRFFDAGGSALDAILAFNFSWVEIMSFVPDEQPQWMFISLFPQGQFESLHVGDFPIITPDEAREMLLQGYFISENRIWPGDDAARAASVELVYMGVGPGGDEEYFMPMYRFLLEVEMPGWAQAEGLWERAAARYYVPAIRREYLEPMTRRPTGPGPEAWDPTARALPPHVLDQLTIWAEPDGWSFVGRADTRRHPEVAALRDMILAEIGGLAPNESYQFRMDDGLYGIIFGNRPLTSREELLRYFPGQTWRVNDNEWYMPGPDLPEQVGDFTLRQILVGERQGNTMLVFDRPMPPYNDIFAHGSTKILEQDPAPVGEKFTRLHIIHSLFALYENSEGVQVGFGVTWPIFGMPISPETHTYIEGFGWMHFDYGNWIGLADDMPGMFRRVTYQDYEQSWAEVQLWFVDPNWDGRGDFNAHHHIWGSTGTLTFATMEELAELVRIFDPAALVREFDWYFMSMQ